MSEPRTRSRTRAGGARGHGGVPGGAGFSWWVAAVVALEAAAAGVAVALVFLR
jgi:hypothetical protein